MKRLICLMLLLILLCGCGSEPAGTTAPIETTIPVETSVSSETTLPPEIAAPAIRAGYAAEDFNAYHAYWSDETDYITSIGFTPAERLTDVKFGLLDWFETESYVMNEVLYTIDEMDPDHCFLAQVVFWGDMTTYGISFTDESGEARHYAVSISGRDGSLVCTEYEP